MVGGGVVVHALGLLNAAVLATILGAGYVVVGVLLLPGMGVYIVYRAATGLNRLISEGPATSITTRTVDDNTTPEDEHEDEGDGEIDADEALPPYRRRDRIRHRFAQFKRRLHLACHPHCHRHSHPSATPSGAFTLPQAPPTYEPGAPPPHYDEPTN